MPQVKCKICKKEFYVKPCHQRLGGGKYCSRECKNYGQRKGKYVRCHICNKEVWKAPKALQHSKSGYFFCSKSCQTQWRNKYYSGPKHPNWVSGKNINYRKILSQYEPKSICKRCGLKDARVLNVHHKDQNRRNNEPNNLVWLCMSCHYLVHYHKEKIK